MRFEWDERKNRLNIRKHGFDFVDAAKVFAGPMVIALDDREDYGEERLIGIGILEARTVVVVYVERGINTIRIISLRKALSYEKKQYEEALRNGLVTY
jgi:hypothetical protein